MTPFDAGRLERLLAEQGMDAVLASSRHNVRYLTGGHYHHFFARTQRLGGGQYLAMAAVPRGAHGRFVAHDVGMVSHEPPDIEAGSARPLEPGMVLSLETEFRKDGVGHVKFEDSVAITATGCEIESAATWKVTRSSASWRP